MVLRFGDFNIANSNTEKIGRDKRIKQLSSFKCKKTTLRICWNDLRLGPILEFGHLVLVD